MTFLLDIGTTLVSLSTMVDTERWTRGGWGIGSAVSNPRP